MKGCFALNPSRSLPEISAATAAAYPQLFPQAVKVFLRNYQIFIVLFNSDIRQIGMHSKREVCRDRPGRGGPDYD